jgi:hypothetical protein
MARRRKQFSIGSTVVIRYSDRASVGKIQSTQTVGKKLVYTVEGEDGKIYDELSVDSNINYCIDTYLTRLFYKKYDIDENTIPTEEDESLDNLDDSCADEVEELGVLVFDEEEVLHVDDDEDSNW